MPKASAAGDRSNGLLRGAELDCRRTYDNKEISTMKPLKETKGNARKMLAIGVLLTVLVLSSWIAPTDTAMAGTNGQQLAVYTGSASCLIVDIYVRGTNQNNQYVTWHPYLSSPTQIVNTWNWWWKGTVTVQYRARKNGVDQGWSTIYQDVPTSQPANSYYKDMVFTQARCW